MKYDVSWTLAVMILAGQVATTHAQQVPPTHAGESQAALGHRLPTDAWARQTDFATASAMASVGDVSPPAVGRRGEVENDEAGLAQARRVPEPSAWLMMLAGLGAIGVVIVRRGSSREA